ncbi:polysaccharide biosynthesis/export family protein [Achromobacter sp. ACRQX]|uniref:polysaccharide biosynthesis/export family protein n=1 Tax=Achromobacter sp. ACRQX TaxID=2918181 RepID=UPI001EF3AD1A|nr:polysaccharide biosynthesis/export family protein [Achromobacter sp. ACRQX]MCG7325641.1 polysaccharide biosynthesis/export family protein [Achromobacter sp. ACRQX]
MKHRFSSVRSVALVLPLLLGGCGSLLSSAGPSRFAIMNSEEAQNYVLVDLSADTLGPYMRPPESEVANTVALPTVPDINLVPGDVLRIMIADSAIDGAIFAPLASGGTVFENIRVDSKGTVSLPYVGRERVAGKTLEEVETLVRRKLKGITSDVQVQVTLTGDLSGSVLVAGAVKNPGRFSALQGPLTLLDAINRAGGPLLEPHLIKVVVRTGQKSYQFNYQDLLAGKNQVLPPGAEVVLERARKRFVAMGAVGDPGLHDLPSNNPSLLEVLGSVKGLSEMKADAAGVFVFRLDESHKNDGGATEPVAKVFRLNLKEPESVFIARQFLVQPEDAIFVTNAAVHEWQKIISPIVQVLVLGRTIENL